jgi:hypothetical protein
MGFALLEAVFDVCAGCLVYTYVLLPMFGDAQGVHKPSEGWLER